MKERDPENFQKNVREAYIDAIVANIKSRFPDMTIITSFGIFDPNKTPATSSESFTEYGEVQLEVLIQHFGEAYLDQTALQQEWIYTKQLLADSFSSLSTREVLEMILKDTSLTTLLPQIHKLAAIALTIPITTANCERGFSAVKRIKTSL